jgi:hypothetical protein
MIIEVAIITAGVVSIFGSSLGFAYRILKMQAKQNEGTDPRAERRRVLERQRETWIKAAKDSLPSQKETYLLKAAEIELIRLGEHEPAHRPEPTREFPVGDVIHKARWR